jgi:plastocyanin
MTSGLKETGAVGRFVFNSLWLGPCRRLNSLVGAWLQQDISNALERGSKNMISTAIRTFAVLLTTVLIGISSARAADAVIKIDNFTFTPDAMEVSVGTTVVWTNGDDIPHAVAAAEHQFKSHALDTGDSFSYTFSQPGTYQYFCSLHPHMTGKVVVK